MAKTRINKLKEAHTEIQESELHSVGAEFLKYLHSPEGQNHKVFKGNPKNAREGEVSGFKDVGIPYLCYLTSHQEYDFKALLKELNKGIAVGMPGKGYAKLGVTSVAQGHFTSHGKDFLVKIRFHDMRKPDPRQLFAEFYAMKGGKTIGEPGFGNEVGVVKMEEEAQNQRVLTVFNVSHKAEIPIGHKEALVRLLFNKKLFKPTPGPTTLATTT